MTLVDIQSKAHALAATIDALVAQQPQPTPTPSQNVLVLWMKLSDAITATDQNLAQLASLGVNGLCLQGAELPGLGGTDVWSQVTKSFVDRCKAQGITKVWLLWRSDTGKADPCPYGEWFDDSRWNPALTAMGTIAAHAKAIGCAGVAFDHEPYSGASWKWQYAGNTRSEPAVRAEAKIHGVQVMTAIVNQFPNVEILSYWDRFDGSKQASDEGRPPKPLFSAEWCHIDYWDGLTSVPGWKSVGFADAAFYLGGTQQQMTASRDGTMKYLIGALPPQHGPFSVSPFLWFPTNGDGSPYYSQNPGPLSGETVGSSLHGSALSAAQNARATCMNGMVHVLWQQQGGDGQMPWSAGSNPAAFTSRVGRGGDFRPAFKAARG